MLLTHAMNANCASYPKVSLALGFKNPTQEDSYHKSATPEIYYDRTNPAIALRSLRGRFCSLDRKNRRTFKAKRV
ncbi:MAG: hypothetical protein EWV50_16515 [Microcystis aeruginosa Ma_MB_F_20061100_S20]|uniref:Uncharacterized protein n=1 Tax=Microcystis aeruginosa Ma_MB_F_20061100_S20D TaxID=2486253 RepID=A0A552ET81_MICAE|nr:MAG: hypothetical protein EWV50_16515 [Microcystis aeruginosa Ma_MB_F_20061100_S20]TRU37667.1 MAG: hypothetical protein EWV78_06750 [Microcystis aeruginosa Ma_MB_F_20061100_S20D]